MRLRFCTGKKPASSKAPKGGGLFGRRRRGAVPAEETATGGALELQPCSAKEEATSADEKAVVPRLPLESLRITDDAPASSGASAAAVDDDGAVSDVFDDSDVEEEHAKGEAACAAALRSLAERTAQLREAALAAKAHRSNCLPVASYAADVAGALEKSGDMLAVGAAACQLEELASLTSNATALATSCAAPGWLLRAAAADDHTIDGLKMVQGKMAALAQGEALASVPGLLHLAPPALMDGTRALHRRLRQLGAGSLAAGLALLAREEDEQIRIAEELGVAQQDVAEDSLHTLQAGLLPADASSDSICLADGDAIAAHRPALEATYGAFAAFGLRGEVQGLDGSRFAKLMREAGLEGAGRKRLPAEQLGVLFAGAVGRGTRWLSFEAFLRLLGAVASKTGATLNEVAASVAAAPPPAVRGTTPEAVRFHDDRSTYTGVYKRGGMCVTDDRLELASLVDRDAANKAQRRAAAALRRSTTASPAPPLSRAPSGLTPGGSGASTPRCTAGVELRTPGTAGSATGGLTPHLGGAFAAHRHTAGQRGALTPRGDLTPRGGPTPRGGGGLTPRFGVSSLASPRPTSAAMPGGEDTPEARNLRLKFNVFAAFGRPNGGAGAELALDSAQFLKLCRDAKLLSSSLTSTRVDLIFTGALNKGSRRMNFHQFLASLPRLAEARGCGEADVVRRLMACEGPSRNKTTTPDSVRLFDDKSNFTGIAARGGPNTVEQRVTLEALCDRSGRRSSLLAPVQ